MKLTYPQPVLHRISRGATARSVSPWRRSSHDHRHNAPYRVTRIGRIGEGGGGPVAYRGTAWPGYGAAARILDPPPGRVACALGAQPTGARPATSEPPGLCLAARRHTHRLSG